MVKKLVFILLLSIFIVVGCSANTEQKVENGENENTEKFTEEEIEVVEETTEKEEEEPEEEVVEEVSTYEVDTVQEQLAKDFELDMEEFDANLNEVQSSLAPIVTALTEGTEIEEESFSILLTHLNESIQFIKGMQDYSQMEKYKKTYEHFFEGTGYLVGAYAFFNNFQESSYTNTELFVTGFENYNKAIEEYGSAGTMFGQESQQ